MSWGFVDDDPAPFLPSEIPHFNKTMEYHIKNIPEKPWFFKSVHDEFNYIIKNVKLNSKYLDQYIRIDVILAFYNIVIKDCYHYEDIMEGFERFQKSFRDTNPGVSQKKLKLFNDLFKDFIEMYHKLINTYKLIDYGSHKMVFECKNPKYVFKLYKTKKTCSREKFAYDNVSKDIVPKMKFISPMMAIVERAIPFSHVNLNTSELYCRDDDPERIEINEYLEKHYKDICGDFRINNFGMLKGKPVILDIDMIRH